MANQFWDKGAVVMNRCDICLEETCGGSRQGCNCSACANVKECYRFLHPTIRITNKCTQNCAHCAFASSPDSNVMMGLPMAERIAVFLKSNEIVSLNVMGGEFFCNPDWFEILNCFFGAGCSIRFVTNSDWYNSDTVKSKLLKLKDKNFFVAVSNDMFHANAGVAGAEAFLSDNSFNYSIESTDSDYASSIVPVGRSEGDMNWYSMFSCYCHNPMHKYSFLIDEEGLIYKCSFGVLGYADIGDYLDGGFANVFKEFNKKFYDTFISSCASCIRVCDKDGIGVKRK